MARFRVLSKNSVKLLCMLTMFLNHVSYWFLVPGTLLGDFCTYIGWVTAPCMCWFLVQGFHYTRDRRRYGVRLLVFAILSQWPYMAYFGPPIHMNMIVTLFLCYLGLCVRHSRLDAPMRAFLQILLFLMTIACDWPMMAFVMTVLFDRSRSKGVMDDGHGCHDWSAFVLSLCLVAVYNLPDPGAPAWQMLFGVFGPAIAMFLIMVCLDTSKRPAGTKFDFVSKYFFYVFYPLHLTLLYFIHAGIV